MNTTMWTALIVLCIVAKIQGDDGEFKEIKTPQGPVRGRKDPAGLYVFNNIPYASAPVGPYKFGAPLPAPAWLQPLETSEKLIICPQAIPQFISMDNFLMQEDCLIANVYVPITDEKNLPVLVYVHGGAFELGFGAMLSPKQLVKEHNIIVVTFNYRLGVHGFLCLGTAAAPGNAGMKDQVQLLKWVNRNIASYGGNPEEVTIAGYSAGSMSVDLLMLSKSAKGLFNRVIQESGACVSSSTVQINPVEGAKKLARKLNFTNVDDIYALEEFYKDTPLKSLLGSTFTDHTDTSLPFGPCVEREASTAFLSNSPINIIKSGDYKKVPTLVGFTNLEGSIMVEKFDTWKDKMNEKFSDFLPADLHFESESEKEEFAKKIKQFYFNDEPVGDTTIISYIDYFSDVYFVYSTLKSVKLHAENGHNEIYLYEYSFVDQFTPFVPYTEVRGAGHCDQTAAIFDGDGNMNGTGEAHISEEFKKMKSTMRELWSNFVKYGKPVPEGSSLPSWPTAGVDCSPHMSLGQTIELRGKLGESRTSFWDDIYEQHYQEPMPPPNLPHTEL